MPYRRTTGNSTTVHHVRADRTHVVACTVDRSAHAGRRTHIDARISTHTVPRTRFRGIHTHGFPRHRFRFPEGNASLPEGWRGYIGIAGERRTSTHTATPHGGPRRTGEANGGNEYRDTATPGTATARSPDITEQPITENPFSSSPLSMCGARRHDSRRAPRFCPWHPPTRDAADGRSRAFMTHVRA